MRGFTLIEMMIALVVLTFGLLTAGQMLFIAASSGSLARSKGTAAIIAQHKLESLAGLYQQDPLTADLTLGDHGPEQTQIINPSNGTILNRNNIQWNVSSVFGSRRRSSGFQTGDRDGYPGAARRSRKTAKPV